MLYKISTSTQIPVPSVMASYFCIKLNWRKLDWNTTVKLASIARDHGTNSMTNKDFLAFETIFHYPKQNCCYILPEICLVRL